MFFSFSTKKNWLVFEYGANYKMSCLVWPITPHTFSYQHQQFEINVLLLCLVTRLVRVCVSCVCRVTTLVRFKHTWCWCPHSAIINRDNWIEKPQLSNNNNEGHFATKEITHCQRTFFFYFLFSSWSVCAICVLLLLLHEFRLWLKTSLLLNRSFVVKNNNTRKKKSTHTTTYWQKSISVS